MGEERTDEHRGLKGTLVSTIKVHEPCTFKYLLKNLSVKYSSAPSQMHLKCIFIAFGEKHFCKDSAQRSFL